MNRTLLAAILYLIQLGLLLWSVLLTDSAWVIMAWFAGIIFAAAAISHYPRGESP